MPDEYAKILVLCIGIFLVLCAGILLGLPTGILTVFILRQIKFSSVLSSLQIYPCLSPLSEFIISVWIVFLYHLLHPFSILFSEQKILKKTGFFGKIRFFEYPEIFG